MFRTRWVEFEERDSSALGTDESLEERGESGDVLARVVFVIDAGTGGLADALGEAGFDNQPLDDSIGDMLGTGGWDEQTVNVNHERAEVYM